MEGNLSEEWHSVPPGEPQRLGESLMRRTEDVQEQIYLVFLLGHGLGDRMPRRELLELQEREELLPRPQHRPISAVSPLELLEDVLQLDGGNINEFI